MNALIVGLGREGLALARYLGERGDAVTVADGRPAAELGADAGHWPRSARGCSRAPIIPILRVTRSST